MIDLFKSSIKSVLLGAGILSCAHAELTIDQVIDLLHLQIPRKASVSGGAPLLPGGMPPPPPPEKGAPKSDSKSFPRLRKILETRANTATRNKIESLLNMIDKMYGFSGTLHFNGKSIPYKSSKDIEHIRTVLNIRPINSGSLKALEDLASQVNRAAIDVNTVNVTNTTLFAEVQKFLDVDGDKINFLKKVDDPLMPENEKLKLEKIIETVRANEASYIQAVRDRNQNLTDASNVNSLKPFGFGRISEPVLENIVANIKKEELEGVLLKYFAPICRLSPDDEGRREKLKGSKDTKLIEKTELDKQQSDFLKKRLKEEGYTKAEFKFDPQSTQSETVQRQNFAIKHFKDNREYNEKEREIIAELLRDEQGEFATRYAAIVEKSNEIREIDAELLQLSKAEYSYNQFKASLNELISMYPLNVGRDTVDALKSFGPQNEMKSTTASVANSSSSVTKLKPEVKKEPAEQSKRPALTRSVATTKTEKEAVKEEKPFRVELKKSKTETMMETKTEENSALKKKIKDLNEDLKNLRSKHAKELMDREEAFKEKLENKLKQYKIDNYNHSNQIEKQENQIKQQEGKIKTLQEQLEELQRKGNADTLKNNENNSNAKAELENLKKLNNELKERNSVLERDLAAERAKTNNEKNTKEIVTERIVRRGGTTTVVEDTERINALTKDVDARNAQLSQQQSALDSKGAQIRQLQQRNQQLQNQLNAQEDNKPSQASNEPSVNEENLKLQRQQLEEMAAELENKQNELKDREAEVSKREQTLNQMQQTTNNVLQMLNRQNNEASQNINAGQSEATKNGNVEMIPQVQLGA